jgi:hypothetical protein
LIVVATTADGLLLWQATLTGSPFLDGIISIMLGLYICSHPAASAVDLLFFPRHPFRQLTSSWTGLGWAALNGLALLLGWWMIALGTARLAAHTP